MRISKFANGILTYRDATPEEVMEFERKQEEMPAHELTPEEQIEELRAQNEMLMECLLEISEIIYA